MNVSLELDDDGVELKSRKEYLGIIEGGCETLESKCTDERRRPLGELRDPSTNTMDSLATEFLFDDFDRCQNLLFSLSCRL